MTPQEKLLAAELLSLASDRFANQNCNDFDLSKVIPDADERRKLIRDYHQWNGDPEEFNPGDDYEIWFDWCLMAYLADKLKGCLTGK